MKTLAELLLVAAGGACGATLRYLITIVIGSANKGSVPWATLAANVIGCTLIGLLMGSEQDQKSEWLRLIFGVGFLGALTTFSTFGAETIRNVHAGNYGIAVSNVVLNVSFSLIAVAIGMNLGKKIWS